MIGEQSSGLPAPLTGRSGEQYRRITCHHFHMKPLWIRVLCGITLWGSQVRKKWVSLDHRRPRSVKPEDCPSHLYPQLGSAGPRPAESLLPRQKGETGCSGREERQDVAPSPCSYFLDHEYPSQISWLPGCSQGGWN